MVSNKLENVDGPIKQCEKIGLGFDCVMAQRQHGGPEYFSIIKLLICLTVFVHALGSGLVNERRTLKCGNPCEVNVYLFMYSWG